MTKVELIKNLANAAEVTNKQAEAVLNALVGTIHGADRTGKSTAGHHHASVSGCCGANSGV